MLTLTLFRHAKSSWDYHNLADFDRPLNERGERDAPIMGHYLVQHRLIPDLILCSAARRTRDTLALASAEWPKQPRTEYSEALYLASKDTILSILRTLSGNPAHVMIIGHNPGIHAFAISMAGSGGADACYSLSNKFPTAAIAIISLPVNGWPDIHPGQGNLTDFIIPKKL